MLPPSGSSCLPAPEVDVSVVIIIFPLWCLGLVTDEGRSLGIPRMLSCNYGVTCWRSPNMASQGSMSRGRVNVPQRKTATTYQSARNKLHFACNIYSVNKICCLQPHVTCVMSHDMCTHFNFCILSSNFNKQVRFYEIVRHRKGNCELPVENPLTNIIHKGH